MAKEYTRATEREMVERIFSGAVGVIKRVVFHTSFFEEIEDSLASAIDYVISMGRLITSVGGG